MAVTIDHEPLATEQLGFRTVGHVLAHIQKDNRLVTSLLIDGLEPDIDRIGTVRQALLTAHTIFIETADPAKMAMDVLCEVEDQLGETDRLRLGAVELLLHGHASRALEKLSGCFGTWQIAQDSVVKVAQLLRIDLETMKVWGRPLTDMLQDFAVQLRQIKTALEHRDFVALTDILTYEATETSNQWREALAAVRSTIQSQ